MKTYKTYVVIWSAIGSTPITKRGGAYCDELFKITVNISTPEKATKYVKELINAMGLADNGHFYMPDYPNQNTRSNFVR